MKKSPSMPRICPKLSKIGRIGSRVGRMRREVIFYSLPPRISANINKPWSLGSPYGGACYCQGCSAYGRTAAQTVYLICGCCPAEFPPAVRPEMHRAAGWLKDSKPAPLCIRACVDLCSNFTPTRTDLLRKIEPICKFFQNCILSKNGTKRRI